MHSDAIQYACTVTHHTLIFSTGLVGSQLGLVGSQLHLVSGKSIIAITSTVMYHYNACNPLSGE